MHIHRVMQTKPTHAKCTHRCTYSVLEEHCFWQTCPKLALHLPWVPLGSPSICCSALIHALCSLFDLLLCCLPPALPAAVVPVPSLICCVYHVCAAAWPPLFYMFPSPHGNICCVPSYTCRDPPLILASVYAVAPCTCPCFPICDHQTQSQARDTPGHTAVGQD